MAVHFGLLRLSLGYHSEMFRLFVDSVHLACLFRVTLVMYGLLQGARRLQSAVPSLANATLLIKSRARIIRNALQKIT